MGSGFKLRGVLFNPKLRMHDAIRKLAVDAGWRLQAFLLRSRRFHSRAALVRLYKAQVLSFLEAATPAIAHACPTLLDRIDRVQRRFLREIGVTEIEALEHFGLAPLCVRRDIAMLGFLHKAAHGKAHPQVCTLLPVAPVHERSRWTATFANRHRFQLLEHFQFRSTDVVRRSAFGRITLFNALPQRVVELPVKQFQRALQDTVLAKAKQYPESIWSSFLYGGLRSRSVRVFQSCFL